MKLSLASILAFAALARSRSHAPSHPHVGLNRVKPVNKGKKRVILDHTAKGLTYLTPAGTSRHRTDVRMELGQRWCGVCQFFGASWLRVRSR